MGEDSETMCEQYAGLMHDGLDEGGPGCSGWVSVSKCHMLDVGHVTNSDAMN